MEVEVVVFTNNASFISMIVLTGIIGSLVGAALIPGSVKGGAIGTIILGVLGALVGAFIAASAGYTLNELSTANIVGAFIGAFVFGLLHKLIFRENNLFRAG
jgi:uncharacterized membrane protein YeaQ/YmgE (transglycosylase-associated protein family)